MRVLNRREEAFVSGGEDRDVWDPDAMGHFRDYAEFWGVSVEQAQASAELMSACAEGSPLCATYLIQNFTEFFQSVVQAVKDAVDFTRLTPDDFSLPAWGNDPHEGGG